jgi:hypothetical protein
MMGINELRLSSQQSSEAVTHHDGCGLPDGLWRFAGCCAPGIHIKVNEAAIYQYGARQ